MKIRIWNLVILLQLSCTRNTSIHAGVYVGPNCPLHPSSDNIFHDRSTDTCYYFYNVQDTHPAAVSRCQDENTRVVELGSKGEQDWLVTNIKEKCKSGPCTSTPVSVWLGLIRHPSGAWNWFYRGNAWPVVSPRWASSSSSSSAGYITAVTHYGGEWRAVTESETAMVVCEELKPDDLARPSTATPQTTTSSSTPAPTTTQTKKALPQACADVAPNGDEMSISEYERLPTNARVLELSVSIKGSRIACAKRCSQKRQCAMFKKASAGVCYLYEVSDTGVSSTCTGDPPTCYWKTCWIPYLDVI